MKVHGHSKEKIIEAATELIRQLGDINSITIRDIAEKSGVGVGLINYHFKTKDNLLNLCIHNIIEKFVEGYDSIYNSIDKEPLERLRYLFKYICQFIADNPGISRISMIYDLQTPISGDNTDKAFNFFFRVLKDVYNDEKSDKELQIILHVLVSTIQNAFLRNLIIKEKTNMDFFNKLEREAFVDIVFHQLFKNDLKD